MRFAASSRRPNFPIISIVVTSKLHTTKNLAPDGAWVTNLCAYAKFTGAASQFCEAGEPNRRLSAPSHITLPVGKLRRYFDVPFRAPFFPFTSASLALL